MVGICAHESAMKGGEKVDDPDVLIGSGRPAELPRSPEVESIVEPSSITGPTPVAGTSAMKTIVVLIATATLLGLAPPRDAFADQKAEHRAMEQQRKAVEAEMRRQAEFERKMVEQQNRAMQEQVRAQQRMMEQQQKAMQQQAMANRNAAQAQAQQRAMQGDKREQDDGRQWQRQRQGRDAGGQARPHHDHRDLSADLPRHPAVLWPHHPLLPPGRLPGLSPEQQPGRPRDPGPSLRLKQSLDSVRMGTTSTQAHKNAIRKGLMGVVEVPGVPSMVALDQLSGSLATGLANRTTAVAQTGPMALTLRGVMNSPAFDASDLTVVVNEHRTALRTSKFRAADITAVVNSIRTITGQTRARR